MGRPSFYPYKSLLRAQENTISRLISGASSNFPTLMPRSRIQLLCAKWYATSSEYVCNKSSTFTFCYHLCQSYLRIQFDVHIRWIQRVATQNALQLPLRRNAARQTQRSIGNECTSGVPKCNTLSVWSRREAEVRGYRPTFSVQISVSI